MKSKKGVILITLLVLIIILSTVFIHYKTTYLFMPYEYQESDVFHREYTDITKPIRLEISDDGFRDSYIFIDDLDEVKFVIEELQKSEYVSRSRGEFNDLEFTIESYGYQDGYQVVIRTLDEEDGGPIQFMFTMYEDEQYIKHSGSFYYYYTITDELREYIIESME